MFVDRRTILFGASALALLPRRPAGAAEASVRIPFTLTGSRVLVDCTLQGSAPQRFVLDTGGTIGLLDMRVVEALKLRRLGYSPLGLKNRAGNYPIYAVKDLVFGGQVRQPVAAFAGIKDFNFGDGAVGSLAAGTLTSVDGELDFAAREWVIHRGGTPDRTGWTRYENAIVSLGNKEGSSFLFADARLGGQAFRFGLDTGMPAALRLYRKTAEAAGVWDAPRWTPVAPNGQGRLARVSLGLGEATVDGVLASMVEEPEWKYFDAGIVGLPVLRLFDMATSASDSTLYLRRNALPLQAERYNRAGIWIDGKGSRVVVAVVGPGSPAAQAGIHAGDTLIGANFDEMLEAMFAPAGTRLPLTVERDGQRQDVVLTLADFL